MRSEAIRDLFTGEFWAPKAPRLVRAHAGIVGAGPKGETCGTCKHLEVNRRQKKFFKCGLVDWSFGPATDIRRKDPACPKWEKPL